MLERNDNNGRKRKIENNINQRDWWTEKEKQDTKQNHQAQVIHTHTVLTLYLHYDMQSSQTEKTIELYFHSICNWGFIKERKKQTYWSDRMMEWTKSTEIVVSKTFLNKKTSKVEEMNEDRRKWKQAEKDKTLHFDMYYRSDAFMIAPNSQNRLGWLEIISRGFIWDKLSRFIILTWMGFFLPQLLLLISFFVVLL